MTPTKVWLVPFRRLRAMFLPSCREMSRHISHSMEQEIRFGPRIGYWLHLALCGTCRRYRLQLVWLRRMVRRFGPETSGRRRLSPEAKAKIKTSLRNGSSNGSPLPG